MLFFFFFKKKKFIKIFKDSGMGILKIPLNSDQYLNPNIFF
jgi:hypothetical protein